MACTLRIDATRRAEGQAVEDAAVRATFDSADAREGVAAFLEKRAPRFGSGRNGLT